MYPLRGGDTEVAELERAWRHLESLLYYEWGLAPRQYLATQVAFGFDKPVKLLADAAHPLYMRGRVDRIDVLEEGYALRSLRLGRVRSLAEESLHPESDLLLGIHVLVTEEALYPDRPVLEASYVHLSLEGATERMFRDRDLENLREKTRAWMLQAASLLEASAFPRTPLISDCQTCAFLRLCGPQAAGASAKVLSQAQEGPAHDFWLLKEALDVG